MYLTAIDLGSSRIKALIGELKKDGSLVIVKAIKKSSSGIKKGEIVYPEETVKSLFEVLSEVRHFDARCIKNLIFSVSGSRSKIILSKSTLVIPHSDFEIIQEDVDRVIKDSTAVNIPPGWEIIHSFPREFIIDDIEVDGTNVVGLSGKKLEANVVLIAVFSSISKNSKKVAELVAGKKGGFDGTLYFAPLASERAVLSRKQRDLGVVLVDMGFDTTGIVVYQDGRLVTAKVLPVGSGNISNDIALGLKCSVASAEKLKLTLGCAAARDVSTKDRIEMGDFEEGRSGQVSKKFVAEIIESRVREIFELINGELKMVGLAGKLPAGAVITGGGSKLRGMVDIAREELRIDAKIGMPNIEECELSNAQLAQLVDDPDMSVAFGLLLSRADVFKKNSEFVSGGSWVSRFLRTLWAS